MRKYLKRAALLLKDRRGNMLPLVVAVTIGMLLIILGVSEYMRLVITAAGIKDAMESAVISTVNDNYNEVYHCVREGYAAGYEPDGESFAASVDYGDIYSRMSFLLGLEEDGDGYVRINNGGEQEYRLSICPCPYRTMHLEPVAVRIMQMHPYGWKFRCGLQGKSSQICQ